MNRLTNIIDCDGKVVETLELPWKSYKVSRSQVIRLDKTVGKLIQSLGFSGWELAE